jgi:hypothetical protein
MIPRTRFARWIPKATITHSEYVMLSVFPRQLVPRTLLNITLYHTVWLVSCTFADTAELLTGM